MESHYQHEDMKTDAELYNGFCKSLHPEKTRARAFTERVMQQFEAEQFQPLLKKIADHVTEHLWDLFRDHICSDTEMNVAGFIQDRIEKSVKALLGGEQWALEKYVLEPKYMDGESIRKAVAKHIPQELQDKRMQEMQAEIDKLKKDLQWERDWNRR